MDGSGDDGRTTKMSLRLRRRFFRVSRGASSEIGTPPCTEATATSGRNGGINRGVDAGVEEDASSTEGTAGDSTVEVRSDASPGAMAVVGGVVEGEERSASSEEEQGRANFDTEGNEFIIGSLQPGVYNLFGSHVVEWESARGSTECIGLLTKLSVA